MSMTTDKPVVFVRFQPETKEALKKAAIENMRSVSSLVEWVMTEWLKEKGYYETGNLRISNRWESEGRDK